MVTAAKAVTAVPTTRAMPNRSPSEAAICDAAKKPMALSAKARLKPGRREPELLACRRRTRWR